MHCLRKPGSWRLCLLLICILLHLGSAPAVSAQRAEKEALPPCWLGLYGTPPDPQVASGSAHLVARARRSSLHRLRDLHEKYADDGLVVIAVDGSRMYRPEFLERRVDQECYYALPFPVVVGGDLLARLNAGLHDERHRTFDVLLDPTGEIRWWGLVESLSNRELRGVLRRAEAPGELAPLAMAVPALPGFDPEDPALVLAARGELAAAHDLAAADAAPQRAIRAALEEHIAGMLERIESAIDSGRDVPRALAHLELLVEELEGHRLGYPARQLWRRAGSAQELEAECSASEELLEIIDLDIWKGYGGVSDRNGTLINKKAYPAVLERDRRDLERVLDRYPGTAGARRAEVLLDQLGERD